MRFKTLFLFTLMMSGLLQTNSDACCAYYESWYFTDTTFIDTPDTAIVFEVTEAVDESEPFVDTIRQSDFFSELKAKFEASSSVLIAKISEVTRYKTEPDTDNYFSYAESVTIVIENVLKGPAIQQKKFIDTISGLGEILIYDPITQAYYEQSMDCSIYDLGHEILKGKQFLLFLSDNEFQSSDLTIKMPSLCDTYTSQYLIDSMNNVYRDEVAVDTTNKKVISTPLITINFNTILQYIQTSTISHKKSIYSANNSQGQYFYNYNLLGKQSTIRANQTDAFRSSGIFISANKNKSSRIINLSK